MNSVEIVVARYQENLNWLRNVPPALRVTLYDKSDAPHEGAMPLPNIGREADTYLHHIVTRYHSLSPLTVFCQGKPFDHAFDFHATLRRLVESPESARAFEPLGHFVDTDSNDGARLFAPWSKNENGRGLEMRGFHRALWNTDGPRTYTFRGGAQFVVTRELVLRQPRDFYHNALHVAQTFPDAAHCFERTWPLVFGVQNPDSAWLAGRETAYLKPMKTKK